MSSLKSSAESRKDGEIDLSRLRTISSFDSETNSTIAMGVCQPPFTPSSLLIESLIEQICKLMEKDTNNQRKLYLTVCEKLQKMNLIGASYRMDELQFMRLHYQRSFYKLLLVAGQTMVGNLAIGNSIPASVSCSEGVHEVSRYSNEFTELGQIARGGFGTVFKARHKLDGEVYAIKKILLRYKNPSSFSSNLMEVKMLARLHHPNIVAYKAAWLEPLDPSQNYSNSQSNSSDSRSSTGSGPSLHHSTNNDSVDVVFEGSNPNQNHSIESELPMPESFHNVVDKISTLKRRVYRSKLGGNESAILYIQMQHCCETLRKWIDDRNHMETPLVDINKCLEILRQILTGLKYIHSQGIVHHDIKPSNIFISEDERVVQVGDFGLACGLIHGTKCGVLEVLENQNVLVVPHRPGMVGTRLYAPPEQLNGFCHAKSDIFSLGIVLFEMLVVFKTSMERSKEITRLKQGQLPPLLRSDHIHLGTLLSRMVSGNCESRPSAGELLGELLSCMDDIEAQRIRKLIKEQETTIALLKEESRAKDQLIEDLRNQVALLMSNHHT